MASASFRKAQSPLLCQLCNNQTIKWKCANCTISMCTKCKCQVHPRFETLYKHNLISIHDIGKEIEQDGPTEVSSEVVSSIFNSYTTDLTAVVKILCCDDDIIYYIGSKNDSKIVKAKLLKASLRVLHTMDMLCSDISFDKNGDVLNFQPNRDFQLGSITSDWEEKSLLDISPMKPLALHLTKDNKLIVGLREDGPMWPVKDFSVRQVVVLGADYKRKLTLERDSKGKRLFSYAARITTDSKNNIYVVDWQDKDYTGRIVSVDRGGHVRFIYKGYYEFDNFVPDGIVVTPSDKIVITDHRNDALHVLNASGHLLALQDVSEIGIIKPYSVSIDMEGFLIIGCSSYNNDAKIHIAKISPNLISDRTTRHISNSAHYNLGTVKTRHTK